MVKISLNEIGDILADALDLDPMEVEEIDGDDDLVQYGLDSISSIQLVVKLEEEYNITFHNDDLLMSRYNTINKLLKVLEKY